MPFCKVILLKVISLCLHQTVNIFSDLLDHTDHHYCGDTPTFGSSFGNLKNPATLAVKTPTIGSPAGI